MRDNIRRVQEVVTTIDRHISETFGSPWRWFCCSHRCAKTGKFLRAAHIRGLQSKSNNRSNPTIRSYNQNETIALFNKWKASTIRIFFLYSPIIALYQWHWKEIVYLFITGGPRSLPHNKAFGWATGFFHAGSRTTRRLHISHFGFIFNHIGQLKTKIKLPYIKKSKYIFLLLLNASKILHIPPPG